MRELDILYADPPEFVVFSLAPHHRKYALTYRATAVKRPDSLIEIDKGKIETRSIDEWLRVQTKNAHSLQTLQDAAYSFRAGYDKAYGIDDIHRASQMVFHIVKDLLFHNGFAARYADIYDIESTPLMELKEKLRNEVRENRDHMSANRVSRFINVCLHNNLNDVVEVLEKILNKMRKEDHANFPDSTQYDHEIMKIIGERLSKAYNRHEQYEQYRS